MLQAQTCPNCGAALPDEVAERAVRCGYCGTLVSSAPPLPPVPPARDPLVPDPSLTEVATLFRAGKRVQATLRYREITGAGLKEARLAMDLFAAGQPLRRPNQLAQ
jgi:hypothetical protein